MTSIDQAFDFERLYDQYPRREGKRIGMQKLQSTIKTQEEYDRFESAMHNYIRLLKRNKTEYQFTKLWQTFVNNWTDYEERQAMPGFESQAERILRGEL